MSNPENSKNNKKSASGLPESFSALISLLYAVCYLVGARIIRYYRRLRRIVRLNCLHIKWAVRRFYFDLKEQRSAAAPSKGYWKREWKKAFSQTRDALHDWNKHRKQPDSGLHLDELLKAFFPSLRKLAGTVNYILPVAGMIVLISTIHHFSTLTFGLRVQYNGEHIGYILSESDFSEAEAKVKERIVNEAYLPPEDSVPIYSLEVVEEDQISDQSILINNIIRASGNEIEEAAGLYVDDEFIGAVKDGDTLLLSLKARKEGTYQPGMTEEELEKLFAPAEETSTEEESSSEEATSSDQTESSESSQPEQEETPSAEETPAAEESAAQIYTIQEGDTPWDIANKFDLSVDELIALNPEVSQTMLVGETLVVSAGSSSASASSENTSSDSQPEQTEETEEPESTSSTAQTEQTYTVQEGDTPWDIANKFDLSVDELIELNPSITDSMLIGDTLIIKAGTSSTSSETSAEEETETSSESTDSETTAEEPASEEQTQSSTTTSKTSPLPPITEEGVTLDSEVVSFVQDIRVEKGLYPVSSVESLDSINAKLDTVVEGEQTYTIQEGDTTWDIANKFDIPTETLLNLNPEVSQSMLVGETFVISQEQPFLQTKVVRTVTQEQEIQFTTETEVDQNKESSYEKVVQEGKNGLKEVTTEITYIDGYETERTVTAETTLVEPVTAKVVVGSLKSSSSSPYNFNGSGTNSTQSNVGGYIWPVDGGYISCPIWGYSGHTGTDIAAPAGTTIWAAKAGTVAYAGWSNGYGYNVLINHADGTKTRYAHCSSLAVYAGQQVSQGQVIGYVGRTGWATGNHCHFEIISGGSYLDARNYIG